MEKALYVQIKQEPNLKKINVTLKYLPARESSSDNFASLSNTLSTFTFMMSTT